MFDINYINKLLIGSLLVSSLSFSLVGCNQNVDTSPVTPDASPIATPGETQSTPPYNKSDIASIDELTAKALEDYPKGDIEVDNNGFVTAEVSLSDGVLTVVITNATYSAFGLVSETFLQFYNGNAFIDIPSKIAYDFILISLPANDSCTKTINLKDTFGNLKQGRYRIKEKVNGGYSYFYATAEFDFS